MNKKLRGAPALWVSGRVVDSRWRGCTFELHQSNCIVSLSKTLYPLLSTGITQEDQSWYDWKTVDWDITMDKKLKGCLDPPLLYLKIKVPLAPPGPLYTQRSWHVVLQFFLCQLKILNYKKKKPKENWVQQKNIMVNGLELERNHVAAILAVKVPCRMESAKRYSYHGNTLIAFTRTS